MKDELLAAESEVQVKAADHGYNVTIVTDATSSLSADWQHAAVNFALTNIAAAIDTAAVVAHLRG